MELVAELNNQGIMLLASAEYDKACPYFENALRMLSLLCDDRNKGVTRLLKRQGRSQKRNELIVAPLPRPTDFIHFFCIEQDEENCLEELMMMQDNEVDGLSEDLIPEVEQSSSFPLLESQGVAISTSAVIKEKRKLENFQNENEIRTEEVMLPLLAILSSVVLYNMALAYHLDGLTQNQSPKLESASCLYEKARLSLAQTVLLCNRSREENLDPLSAVMIDILVLASWNNEGHSTRTLAHYERSQNCFESLHTLAYKMINQILTSGTSYESFLLEASNPPYLEQQGCYQRPVPEDKVFDSLKKKAHFFFLNASCFRNTMSAAAA